MPELRYRPDIKKAVELNLPPNFLYNKLLTYC